MDQAETDRLATALVERLTSQDADVQYKHVLAELDLEGDVALRGSVEPAAALARAIHDESEAIREYLAALDDAAQARGVANAISTLPHTEKDPRRLVLRLGDEHGASMQRARRADEEAQRLRPEAEHHIQRLRLLLYIRDHQPQ